MARRGMPTGDTGTLTGDACTPAPRRARLRPPASTGILLVVILAAATAAAQSLATVQGFVSDDTGASLPG